MAAAAEIARATILERPPEDEIYGRSLSTVYRLGQFAVERSIFAAIHSPEAQQVKAEFFTSVEEGFGTDLELGGGLEVRDFATRPVLNGEVMSKDLKTSVSDMTFAGLICAEEKFEKESQQGDNRFGPQLIRSKHDHENATVVNQMVRGKTSYNTRIVASPFPEEAAAQSGDAYWRGIGYVPHLRRGFIQVYHTTKDGNLLAGSLSFDGSNKEQLREVFAKYGVEIPESEVTDNWLKYAITDNLSEEYAKSLALEIANTAADPKYKKNTNTVDVTDNHRAIMDKVFNESYVQACESHARQQQTSATRDLIFRLANQAGSFGDCYVKALYAMRDDEYRFTDDDMVILHELLVYSTIEMMRALHLDKKHGQSTQVRWAGGINLAHLEAMNIEAFQKALSSFGAEGARSNRVYSACGLEIKLGKPGSEAGSADDPQSVFGGKDKDNSQLEDCDFVSKECPKCHKKNVKTTVRKGRYFGACGCRS